MIGQNRRRKQRAEACSWMREELESQSANGIKLYLNGAAVLITYICSRPELLFERRKINYSCYLRKVIYQLFIYQPELLFEKKKRKKLIILKRMWRRTRYNCKIDYGFKNDVQVFL